ncbi:uncharacterized protein LOC106672709 [Cimex lectularius]|uniref:lysozyme n=1 Tax=Cimex lectularius TaxID=79782 RepID=A0A8I6SGL8_CIMLE|nr:uncharacterized protein LOC106672709 [Cimex lectularius]
MNLAIIAFVVLSGTFGLESMNETEEIVTSEPPVTATATTTESESSNTTTSKTPEYDEEEEIEIRKRAIDDVCLQCICEGASGCNRKADNCFENLCGRFRMTRLFWRDAGMPTLDTDTPRKRGAFVNCALDVNCSRRTVISYVNKYARDCNKDGLISCLDYAAIHQLGPVGCLQEKPIDPFFFHDFIGCLNRHFYKSTAHKILIGWKLFFSVFWSSVSLIT